MFKFIKPYQKPHPLSPAESTISAYHLEVPTMLPQRLLRTTTLFSSLRFHQIGLWISLSLSISISSPIFMYFSVPDWPQNWWKVLTFVRNSRFHYPPRNLHKASFWGLGTWQSWSFLLDPFMSCLAVFHQGSLREKLLQSICLIWSKVNLCTLSCLSSHCG